MSSQTTGRPVAYRVLGVMAYALHDNGELYKRPLGSSQWARVDGPMKGWPTP
jgi:hypothetical protein